MRVESLVDWLARQADRRVTLSAREVAELIWLAGALDEPDDAHARSASAPTPEMDKPAAAEVQDAVDVAFAAPGDRPPDAPAHLEPAGDRPRVERRGVRVARPSALPQRRAWARALHRLAARGPDAARPVVDVPSTVRRVAASGLWDLVYRDAEVPMTHLVLILDTAGQVAPWKAQVESIADLPEIRGSFRRFLMLYADLSRADVLEVWEQRGEVHRPLSMRSLPQPGEQVRVVFVTDGLGLAVTEGAWAAWIRTRTPDVTIAWVHPWPRAAWIHSPVARSALPAHVRMPKPDALPIVPLNAEGLESLSGWARGQRTNDLPYVNIPTQPTRVARHSVQGGETDWPERARRFSQQCGPIAAELLGLAAAVPGRLDLPMLEAVAARFQMEADRYSLSLVLSSGFFRRLQPSTPMLVELVSPTAGAAALALVSRAQVGQIMRWLLDSAERQDGLLDLRHIRIDLLLRLERGEALEDEDIVWFPAFGVLGAMRNSSTVEATLVQGGRGTQSAKANEDLIPTEADEVVEERPTPEEVEEIVKQPRLVRWEGTNNEQIYPLVGPTFKVGSAHQNDLQIVDDPNVAGLHLVFRKRDDGWRVRDLAPRLGVQESDVMVGKRSLADGYRIVIGSTTLRFRSSRWRGTLVYLEGTDEELIIPLIDDVTTIGRGRDNDVQIGSTFNLRKDSKVSRFHCKIYRDGNGFVLEDNKSSNGTLVDGELITARPLTGGEEIFIGETRFRFKLVPVEAAHHSNQITKDGGGTLPVIQRGASMEGSSSAQAESREGGSDAPSSALEIATALIYEARLELLETTTYEQNQFVVGDAITIGSDPSCNLQLTANAAVLPLHCEILHQHNMYFIYNIGVAHRTLVDGVPVEIQRLFGGERITVGNAELQFHIAPTSWVPPDTGLVTTRSDPQDKLNSGVESQKFKLPMGYRMQSEGLDDKFLPVTRSRPSKKEGPASSIAASSPVSSLHSMIFDLSANALLVIVEDLLGVAQVRTYPFDLRLVSVLGNEGADELPVRGLETFAGQSPFTLCTRVEGKWRLRFPETAKGEIRQGTERWTFEELRAKGIARREARTLGGWVRGAPPIWAADLTIGTIGCVQLPEQRLLFEVRAPGSEDTTTGLQALLRRG